MAGLEQRPRPMPNAFNFAASPFDCLTPDEQALVRDGVDIAYFPEGAVVLSPQTNMIPVYYAQRHVVRGITDWKVVSKARGELPRVFPDSPYYLAVDPEHRQSFSDPPAFAKELIRSENLLLFALSAPPRDGGPPAHE